MRTGQPKATRSGGYNMRNATAGVKAGPFDPEELRSYELGGKVDWLDGRLRTNVALFYNEMTKMQREIIVTTGAGGGGIGQSIRNTADALIKGAELEVAAAVTPLVDAHRQRRLRRWRLRAGLAAVRPQWRRRHQSCGRKPEDSAAREADLGRWSELRPAARPGSQPECAREFQSSRPLAVLREQSRHAQQRQHPGRCRGLVAGGRAAQRRRVRQEPDERE